MDDPETRIRCENCGLLIRKVDAKYQNGRCIPCDRLFQEDRTELIKANFRKNPPNSQEEIDFQIHNQTNFEDGWIGPFLESIRKPLIDPNEFSRLEFTKALRIAFSKYENHPSKFETELIHLCDPIVRSDPYEIAGLSKIPSPFQSIYAVMIAWQNIRLGAFDQALDNIHIGLDDQIDQGLKLLGCNSIVGLIKAARDIPRDSDLCLPDEIDNELREEFLSTLRDDEFVERVLIPVIASLLGGLKW